MEKFTKSPWVIGATTDNAPFCVDAKCNNDGVEFEVCSVWGSNVDTEPCEQSQANASLIAAAPEMYEMLKKSADELLFMIRKANSDLMQSITSTTESEPDYHDEQTVFEIMQLLAKARGEK